MLLAMRRMLRQGAGQQGALLLPHPRRRVVQPQGVGQAKFIKFWKAVQ